MKMPWADKTGLAKATAFFATLLLVSLGLCGVNLVAAVTFGDRIGLFLTVTAFPELLAIGSSAFGLIVVAWITLTRVVIQRFNRKDS